MSINSTASLLSEIAIMTLVGYSPISNSLGTLSLLPVSYFSLAHLLKICLFHLPSFSLLH